MSEPIDLIDPALVGGNGLVPLRRVLQDIQGLSSEQRNALGDALCTAQEAVHPPFAARTRERLQNAEADGDLDIQLLDVALVLNELKAYALRPNTNSLYGVKSSWWNSIGSSLEREQSIKGGIWAVNRAVFKEQTPEWEVAHRPLYVMEKVAKRLLQPRPPSEAQLRREAQAIIGAFHAENPGADQKMKRADFVAAIKMRLPGCNTTAALRAWKNFKPASWRDPGRRRKSERQ